MMNVAELFGCHSVSVCSSPVYSDLTQTTQHIVSVPGYVSH